ncbi:hypothetical protein MC5_01320 [Rickettsia australis str. Cutlack]|uniref:Uncharacterized protein n=1 Tax=Rickettsia australis (strain Cutlack) TaxID=1105110 RepID=H8K9F1_RICAC|nr:hypothetical protein MC5_01320 [Rickettsia australis str. Cutlack]
MRQYCLVVKNNFKKIYDLFILRIHELNNQFNKTNIYKNEDEPQAKILITSINKEFIEIVNNFFTILFLLIFIVKQSAMN